MERSAYRSNRALEPFLNKVTSLIRNPSSHLRIPSLGLLLHYLQFNNSNLSTNLVLVPAILSALLSNDDEVSSTIRNHIDSLSMSRGNLFIILLPFLLLVSLLMTFVSNNLLFIFVKFLIYNKFKRIIFRNGIIVITGNL